MLTLKSVLRAKTSDARGECLKCAMGLPFSSFAVLLGDFEMAFAYQGGPIRLHYPQFV